MAIGKDKASDAAKKSRKFTKKIFQTQHQWEAQDLEAAGLNRILSLTQGGGGVATPSAPFEVSTAQQLSGVGATGTGAARAGMEASILKSTMSKAKSDAVIAKEQEQTSADVRRKASHDADIASVNFNIFDEHFKQQIMATERDRLGMASARAVGKFDATPAGQRQRELMRFLDPIRGIIGGSISTQFNAQRPGAPGRRR